MDYIRRLRSLVGHEKVILVFAGGCLMNEHGEVLLQKRGDFDAWGFPGGAVELGETPEMAALREVKEETGLDADIGELLGVFTDTDMRYPNGDMAQSICIVYKMKAKDGALHRDGRETLELRYFPLDRTPLLFCRQHEEILAALKAHHIPR